MRRSAGLARLAVPATLAVALLVAPCGAGAQAGPVQLADLNRDRPPGWTVHERSAPYGFQRLGENVVFAGSLHTWEPQCLLWSYDRRSGSVRLLATSDQESIENPCFQPAGVVNGAALYIGAKGSLWRTDGTPEGTRAVTRSGVRYFSYGGGVVTDRRGVERLIVGGCDRSDACGLWRTDGSDGGTERLHGPRGGWIALPRQLVPFQGRIYFIAGSGRLPTGLWRTDGSEEGTVYLGKVELPDAYDASLAASSSALFFTSLGAGHALWVSDGSAEGTRRLRVFGGTPCVDPSCQANVGDLQAEGSGILFRADDGEHGLELWASDGSEAGTRRLSALPPGWSPYASGARRLGGRWVFPVVGDQPGTCVSLWTTLGDPATTAPLFEEPCGDGRPRVVAFFATEAQPEARILFAAEDGGHGAELWGTDGTAAGTARLADACPGPCDAFGSLHPSFLITGPVLLGKTWLSFRASESDSEGVVREEEWSSDGTPEGTGRVLPRPALDLLPLDGRLLAGTSGGEPRALRLWTLDGTPSGSRVEATFLPDREESQGSIPSFVAGPRGALFLSRTGEQGRLYRSDGTASGTVPIAGTEEILPGTFWQGFFPCGRTTYLLRQLSFGAEPAAWELWRSDGAPGSTVPVHRFAAGEEPDFYTAADWQGRCAFGVYRRPDFAFWVSDGTALGTHELFRLPPRLAYPAAVASLGRQLVFLAQVRAHGKVATQIFASYGSWADTRQLTAIAEPRGSTYELPLLRLGGRLYAFLERQEGAGRELWVTDGTVKGTHREVRDFGRPEEIVALPGAIVFSADAPDFACTRNLLRWRPGDAAPSRFAVLRPEDPACSSTFHPLDLTAVGDLAFFTHADEAGLELWRSDGTAGGTRRVRDLRPGSESSLPLHLTPVGGRLYFSARDDEAGRELWTSDGTSEGTRRVFDLYPGPLSSLLDTEHRRLTFAAGKLFFAADDGVHGTEPWALAVEP